MSELIPGSPNNLSDGSASVINNFIDKIAAALHWAVTPKGIKLNISEANASLIDEIANRTDINVIERAAIVNNYKRIVREYTNQVNIVEVAKDFLDENASPEMVNTDWITYFFEMCKNISDVDMQKIWGRLLAGEFNCPNTFTKQFLHTLSIMDYNAALTFLKIRSSCFYREPYLFTFIYRSDNKRIRNIDEYRELRLNFADLRELESMGIIQYRYPAFYTLKNNHKLIEYGDKVIRLRTEKKAIEIGNVSLTDVGKQLCRITQPICDDRVLKICVDTWEKLGYNPQVMNRSDIGESQ